MNIVYIHTHDTGKYISPYGYNVPTPRLQAFAEQSVLFRQAFNAGPTCSPSRSALLTGAVPHSNGMIGLAHRGFSLHDPKQHLASFLQGHGFETVLSGVQHEAGQPEQLGYELILNNSKPKISGEWDTANAELAADYIRKRASRKPFFLSFGMFSTHREFPEIDPSINPDFVVPPFPLADTRQNREDMAAYMSSARIADRCFGIVLDSIRDSGIEEDTLIVFTTDHGIAFPHMKCNLYDTGIGVALLVKAPGQPAGGRAVDALVSHLDLFPTVCELLQIEKPSWLQGHSFVPLLSGAADRIRDHIFSEVTFHAAYEPMRCIRTDRYKYVKLFDEHDQFVPANIDDGLSKTFLLDSGLLAGRRDKEMLFDLHLDPAERVNVIADPRYADIYRDLSGKLRSWMEQTDDPLLLGKVVPPAGAKVNKQSTVSPKSKDFE